MQEKTGYFLNVVAHKLEPRSFYRGHMIQIYSQEAGTNVRVCGVCALVCMCMCVYIYVCVCSHGLVQRLASSNSRSPPPAVHSQLSLISGDARARGASSVESMLLTVVRPACCSFVSVVHVGKTERVCVSE